MQLLDRSGSRLVPKIAEVTSSPFMAAFLVTRVGGFNRSWKFHGRKVSSFFLRKVAFVSGPTLEESPYK